MATEFETFMTTEMALRRALIKKIDAGGYDGDPNDGGAPSNIQLAPLGSWYREETAGKWWTKTETVWEEAGAGGGGGNVLVFDPLGTGTGPSVFNDWLALYTRLEDLREENNGGLYTIAFKGGLTPVVIPVRAPSVPTAPTAAFTGPVGSIMTLTDAGASFTADLIGRFINIVGATTPANNGWFKVTGVPDGTHVEYENALGVAEAFGGATYSITSPWDMTDVSWDGGEFGSSVRPADGCTFKRLVLFNKIGLRSNNTSYPMCVLPNEFLIIRVFDSCNLEAENGTQPFYDVESGIFVNMYIFEGSRLGFSKGGPMFTPFRAGTGIFFRVFDANPVQPPLGGSHRPNMIPGDIGSLMFSQIENTRGNSITSGAPGTAFPSFLGTIAIPQVTEPAFLSPNPFQAPAATAAVTALFGESLRLDASGGAIAQTLPDISNAFVAQAFPGGFCTVVETGGGQVTLTPGAGDTIGGEASFLVPPNGGVVLQSDGISNWDVVGVFDPASLPLVVESEFVRERTDGATVTIWIDPTNGDDANDGLTKPTALASLPGMRAKFPQVLSDRSSRIVNFVNDTAAVITIQDDAVEIGSTSHLSNNYSYRGPDMIPYTLIATGPTTAALDVVPAVQVDQSGAPSGVGNRTRLDFTTAAPGWTVNNFQRAFLRVTRGGNRVFDEIPISENTADTLIVDTLGIVGSILATDTVEIVEPAIKLAPLPGEFVLGLVQNHAHASFGSFIPNPIGATFERLSFADMFVTNVYGVSFDKCLLSHTFGGGNVFLDGTVAFKNTASRWTVSFFCHSGVGVTSRNDDAPLVATPKVGLIIFSGFLQVGGANATIWGAAGRGNFFSAEPVSVYSGKGIIVSGNGSNFAASGSINGVNDPGEVGIHAQLGALVQIPGGDLATITGGAGDLKVGSGAVISYGTAAGEFEEVAGYNGNFTRMLEGTAAAPIGDTSVITTAPIV